MLCRYKFSNPNYRYEQLECVKEECACWHKESGKCADLIIADSAYDLLHPILPPKLYKAVQEWKSGK